MYARRLSHDSPRRPPCVSPVNVTGAYATGHPGARLESPGSAILQFDPFSREPETQAGERAGFYSKAQLGASGCGSGGRKLSGRADCHSDWLRHGNKCVLTENHTFSPANLPADLTGF